MKRTIMSGITLGSDDVGSNTRRREGEVGDKLSSGEALKLLSGHWQRCVAVGKSLSGKTQARGIRKAVHPGYFRSGPLSSSIHLGQRKLS